MRTDGQAPGQRAKGLLSALRSAASASSPARSHRQLGNGHVPRASRLPEVLTHRSAESRGEEGKESWPAGRGKRGSGKALCQAGAAAPFHPGQREQAWKRLPLGLREGGEFPREEASGPVKSLGPGTATCCDLVEISQLDAKVETQPPLSLPFSIPQEQAVALVGRLFP